MGEEGVLLGFVEAVDFVDEKDGADLEVPILAGVFDDTFDVFFAGSDGGDFDEVSFPAVGDDAGEGGFADAGRAPENEVDGFVVLDDFVKNLAVADKVGLADNFGKSFWPDFFG